MNFKITILFCAGFFFAKEVFGAELPLAEIQDTGTPEQVRMIEEIFERTVMHSEARITRRLRNIGLTSDPDEYVKIYFKDLAHLEIMISDVPEIKAPDDKIVFVFDKNAPDDYRQAIITSRGIPLTYGRLFHIESESPMRINGNINAPEASFVFSSPSIIETGNGESSFGGIKIGKPSLESKLEGFLTMYPQMTPQNTLFRAQTLLEALTRPSFFPVLRDIINGFGFIAGQGLSYTAVNAVDLKRSLVLVASNMEQLAATQENFKYAFPEKKINLIQEGYDGVFYDAPLVRSIAMLIESNGFMVVSNTKSPLSIGCHFFYKSRGDMYIFKEFSGNFKADRNIYVDYQNGDYVADLIVDQNLTFRPGVSMIDGNPELSPR